MKTYVIVVLVAGVLLAVAGFVLRDIYGPKSNSAATPPPVVQPTPPVDTHGCDVAGGFVWCEPKQKCLQLWDEKCEGVVPATNSGKVVKKVTN